ncbi:L,D-transpeptidase family protein [Marichromatium bheemlicum]|uniref:L,D-transpeptidase family protein n=2 Tax=Marichromatium bheemlicum TaxID=365339 RepID=A0ABX1IBD5_9GAMM|nr:L,D-transpeptidase family protein [Marichromatium bheemlicum]
MSLLALPRPLRPATPPDDFRPPRPDMADRVLVRKAERRLYLLRDGVVLRSYAIALGFQPIGHKRREGDGRTPEGRYRIDWRNPASRFHRALHISYPGPGDRLRARLRGDDPGGAIMVHGTGPDTRRNGDWTAGCIAVDNAEIEQIWSLVADGTPIEILP